MGKMSMQQGAAQLRKVSDGVVANAATATAAFPVQSTPDGIVTITIDFTLGSLTNATFTPQVSDDGTTWRTASFPGALGPLSANGNYAFPVFAKGQKFVRVSCSSTGTTTGSSAAIRATYQSGAY